MDTVVNQKGETSTVGRQTSIGVLTSDERSTSNGESKSDGALHQKPCSRPQPQTARLSRVLGQSLVTQLQQQQRYLQQQQLQQRLKQQQHNPSKQQQQQQQQKQQQQQQQTQGQTQAQRQPGNSAIKENKENNQKKQQQQLQDKPSQQRYEKYRSHQTNKKENIERSQSHIVPGSSNQFSVKSAELRRKSDTHINKVTMPSAPVIRRKSEAALQNQHVLQNRSASPIKKTVNFADEPHESRAVLFHQQRSVVHVSGDSTVPSPPKPPSDRNVVTSQPCLKKPLGSSQETNIPFLTDVDYDNFDGEIGDKRSLGSDGIGLVAEGVKGLVRYLYIPFQCCKSKVFKVRPTEYNFLCKSLFFYIS